MSAILKPPSRTILPKAEYMMLLFSIFSPRAVQRYLKALEENDKEYPAHITKYDILEVADFTEERACCHNGETNPHTPDKTTYDSQYLVAEKLNIDRLA
jgi:hypothetical protein